MRPSAHRRHRCACGCRSFRSPRALARPGCSHRTARCPHRRCRSGTDPPPSRGRPPAAHSAAGPRPRTSARRRCSRPPGTPAHSGHRCTAGPARRPRWPPTPRSRRRARCSAARHRRSTARRPPHTHRGTLGSRCWVRTSLGPHTTPRGPTPGNPQRFEYSAARDRDPNKSPGPRGTRPRTPRAAGTRPANRSCPARTPPVAQTPRRPPETRR
jgi:hypothetical protein